MLREHILDLTRSNGLDEDAGVAGLNDEEALQQIRCPVLLSHGDDDHIADIGFSRMLAEKRPDWSGP